MGFRLQLQETPDFKAKRDFVHVNFIILPNIKHNSVVAMGLKAGSQYDDRLSFRFVSYGTVNFVNL